MSDIPYWSLRGRERRAAKELYCAAHPLENDDGGDDEPQHKKRGYGIVEIRFPDGRRALQKGKALRFFRTEAEGKLEFVLLKGNQPPAPENLDYTESGGKLFVGDHELWTDGSPRLLSVQLKSYSDVARHVAAHTGAPLPRADVQQEAGGVKRNADK